MTKSQQILVIAEVDGTAFDKLHRALMLLSVKRMDVNVEVQVMFLQSCAFSDWPRLAPLSIHLSERLVLPQES